jgi:putative spermidine/putrescine transport system permease protein
MALPPYATPFDRATYYALRVFCSLIFIFLIAPVIAIIPLSFNAEPYFTYPMPGFSLRWYAEVLGSDDWRRAFSNSVIVGFSSMLIATALGTTAALGLARADFAAKRFVTSILVAPMAVPIVIIAVAMYYFFAALGLTSTLFGIVLAHSALGVPFVVITVGATLAGFDKTLVRAAAGLGAGPLRVFFTVMLPIILPGVLSGAIFAFVTSWDDVVVVLLLAGVEQHTLPRRMWTGVRERLDPSLLAVATILIALSIGLMVVLELLRRRNARLRGMND